MVSSVSSSPYYSYLSQLQGVTGTASSTAATAASVASAAGSSGTGTSASLVSSLLGTSGYSPTVLSLLQQNSSGGFDPISTILGGSSGSNSGLTSLYSGLYDSAAAASLQTAQINGTSSSSTAATTTDGSSSTTSSTTSSATESPVQALIDSQTQASIAYNQTLQQNAANILAAGESQTDSII